MTQNFRRRITLLPDTLGKILNSNKKCKEIDLEEKADEDTFNKSTMNIVTPKKINKLDLSLLETPIIEKEKRLRRISVHSPLNFNENSSLNKSPNSFVDQNFYNGFYNFSFGDFLDKNVSNFQCQFSPEKFLDNPNFDSLQKRKGVNNNNKIPERAIILNDKDNNNYLHSVYNDREIYGKNNIIDQDNAIMKSNFEDNDNSDEEHVQNGQNLCLKNLKEAIYNYSKGNYHL